MKRLTFAIAGSAALLLSACGGGNDDAINDADANSAQVDELNALATDAANDAANQMEAESLANQSQQLSDEANASANADAAKPPAADDEAMNVAGM